MIKNIRKGREGFTLIELMIVVAIVGVLAVLAVYGVRRYIANAKTAEARTQVGAIARSAAAAYEREKGASTILTAGGSSASLRSLCSSSTKVPATPPPGGKYQSAETNWDGDGTAGWKCLKFSMSQPQYYSYQYVASNGSTFSINANGDLNGDTTVSTFALAGSVVGGQITIAPTVAETDPEE